MTSIILSRRQSSIRCVVLSRPIFSILGGSVCVSADLCVRPIRFFGIVLFCISRSTLELLVSGVGATVNEDVTRWSPLVSDGDHARLASTRAQGGCD